MLEDARARARVHVNRRRSARKIGTVAAHRLTLDTARAPFAAAVAVVARRHQPARQPARVHRFPRNDDGREDARRRAFD